MGIHFVAYVFTNLTLLPLIDIVSTKKLNGFIQMRKNSYSIDRVFGLGSKTYMGIAILWIIGYHFYLVQQIYRYSFYNIPFFVPVMGMLVLIYSLFYPHMVCAIRGSKVQQQLIIKRI